jgi:hypothetical protein
MPTRDLERIIEVLSEIRSDIRSIRTDITSLLARPSASASGDSPGEQPQLFAESVEPPDPNAGDEVIRYLREKSGYDEIGSD